MNTTHDNATNDKLCPRCGCVLAVKETNFGDYVCPDCKREWTRALEPARKHDNDDGASCSRILSLGFVPYWRREEPALCGKRAHWVYTDGVAGEQKLCGRHARSVGLIRCNPLTERARAVLARLTAPTTPDSAKGGAR